MANTEKCQKVLDFIIAHPELHSQRTYLCRTTMCIAGTAVMLEKLDEKEILRAAERSGLDLFWVQFFKVGRSILGLTDAEADDLFYTMNDAEALRKLKEFANQS